MNIHSLHIPQSSIGTIDSILSNSSLSDQERLAALDDTELTAYEKEDPQALNEDVYDALSDIIESMSLCVSPRDILSAILLPKQDVTEILEAYDGFLLDTRIDELNTSMRYTTYSDLKVIAHHLVAKYTRIQSILALPRSLMMELTQRLGIDAAALYSPDERHFYLNSDAGSMKFRFADHSFKDGAGRLYQHLAPDAEFILDLSGREDAEQILRTQFWQVVDTLGLRIPVTA